MLRALALLAAVVTSALALDTLVPGTKLDVRAGRRRESLRFVAKGRFTLPAPGSPDDPAIAGATFTLVNPTTGESHVFTLPGSNWTAGQRGTSFRYRGGARAFL